MKIGNKEFLNPQDQLVQNTKDIEKLKTLYKPIYSFKGTFDEVIDATETTTGTIDKDLTDIPEGVESGWLMDFTGLIAKIKAVSNTTVLIDVYASVASQVPGPQGETGATGATGATGPQGMSIYYSSAELNTTIGGSTTISVGTISMPGVSVQYHKNDLIIGSNSILGQITLYNGATVVVKSMASIKGAQGEPGQTTIGIEVVAELPETGEEGIIYFVPKEDGETGDEYDEYTYVDNDWELLGSAQVDLSDYALKSEIPVIDENLVPKSDGTYKLGSTTNAYANTYTNTVSNKTEDAYIEFGHHSTNGGSMSIGVKNANAQTTGYIGLATDGNGYGQVMLGPSVVPFNDNGGSLGGLNLKWGSAYIKTLLYLYSGCKITDGSSQYGVYLPDMSSYTADKTIAVVEDGAELQYTTTVPTVSNTSGNLKAVVLTSEPATYYNGYIYYITEA